MMKSISPSPSRSSTDWLVDQKFGLLAKRVGCQPSETIRPVGVPSARHLEKYNFGGDNSLHATTFIPSLSFLVFFHE